MIRAVVGEFAFIAIALMLGWGLIRGLQTGIIRARVGIPGNGSVSRAEKPIWFWTVVAGYSVIILIFATIFISVGLDIIFALVLAPAFTRAMIYPAILEFDADGLCFTGPAKGPSSRFKWRDVSSVRVISGRRYGNGVMLTFKSCAVAPTESHLIPGLWSVSDEALARMFDSMRARSQSIS